jgi:uncharacterized membrane protein YvbJ
MAKAQLQCPACGSKVQLDDIECKICGINLKSGESFEVKAKKARGKAVHPEHFSGRIYVGVVVAFGMVVFAGLMYQTQVVEKSLAERPDLYQGAVEEFQGIEDLLARGGQEAASGDAKAAAEDYRNARERTQKLRDGLKATADAIRPEEPYAKDDRSPYVYGSQEPKYNRTVAKRVLYDLAAKAENELNRIPTT